MITRVLYIDGADGEEVALRYRAEFAAYGKCTIEFLSPIPETVDAVEAYHRASEEVVDAYRAARMADHGDAVDRAIDDYEAGEL